MDIVPRLREHASDFRRETTRRFAAELNEAANEIDRMRAALAEIRDSVETFVDGEVSAIVARALGQGSKDT